jgi:zinc transporter ZupT
VSTRWCCVQMPDSFEDLGELVDYPLTTVMTMAGAVFVLTLEQVMSYVMDNIGSKPASSDEFSEPTETTALQVVKHVPLSESSSSHGHSHGLGEVDLDGLYVLDTHSFVKAVVMDLSVAVHSVIIGIALGVNTDAKRVRVLTIAFLFHQSFEGLGLGVAIAMTRLAWWKKLLLVSIFCTTTAVGIGVGILLESQYKEDSTDHKYARGVLNAFASGNLIYISLVEMLGEDFNAMAIRKRPRLKLAMYCATLAGAGALAALAYWA